MSDHLFSREVVMAAKDVLDICRENQWKVATAESCTGGLIAAVLTEIAGSSDVVDRGFVTYSNAAKNQLLGVPLEMIESDGAVSERVARAMAEGALERSEASITISCTGVAGPGGGSAEKPMAAARADGPTLHERCLFPDDGRAAIRQATVLNGFAMIRSLSARPMIA